MEWAAFPFSRGLPQPRDRTQVSHIASRFFTSWATRLAHKSTKALCGSLETLIRALRNPVNSSAVFKPPCYEEAQSGLHAETKERMDVKLFEAKLNTDSYWVIFTQNWPVILFNVLVLISCCCCSFIQLCPTLCDPMDCSMPGLPVPHHLPEFSQAHVHCIGDSVHSLLSSE